MEALIRTQCQSSVSFRATLEGNKLVSSRYWATQSSLLLEAELGVVLSDDIRLHHSMPRWALGSGSPQLAGVCC